MTAMQRLVNFLADLHRHGGRMVDALILDAQMVQQVIGAYLFFQSARRIHRSALLQFHNEYPLYTAHYSRFDTEWKEGQPPSD